jgi:hypothetical protein
MHDSTLDPNSFTAFTFAWSILADLPPRDFDEDSDFAWILWRLREGVQVPITAREQAALGVLNSHKA